MKGAGNLVEGLACLLADMEGDRGDWVSVWNEDFQQFDAQRRWKAKVPAAEVAIRHVLTALREPSSGMRDAGARTEYEQEEYSGPEDRRQPWAAWCAELPGEADLWRVGFGLGMRAAVDAFAAEHGIPIDPAPDVP